MNYTQASGEPATSLPKLKIPFADLTAAFNSLADPRQAHNRLYSLTSLLLALSAAILCNHLSILAAAEWLADQTLEVKQALGFTNGKTPHQSTFHRAFKKLSVFQLETALTNYFDPKNVGQLRPRATQSVAIDGKCQRGRLPFEVQNQTGTPCHLLSAFCQQIGQVLAQVAIENKEAELTVAAALIDQLDWQGRVLTGDAIFCQRKICRQVFELGGDYLLVVKGNQATLQDNIAQLFEEPSEAELARLGFEAPAPLDIAHAKQVDKGHGRVEIREIKVSSELAEYVKWPYLAQVFEIKRQWHSKGKWHSEVHLAISSLPAEVADPLRLLSLRRGHWGIENKLHWVRDVVLGEDKSTIHLGAGPQVVGAIRNTVLNVLRKAGHAKISAQLRYNSRNPIGALTLLGISISSA
jgi:predicted transposase YbfD/YdcC